MYVDYIDYELVVFVHREAEGRVTPRRTLQTVHTDVTGHTASRPAQEPGRFQVPD